MLKYRQIYYRIALVLLFVPKLGLAQRYTVETHGLPERFAVHELSVDSAEVVPLSREIVDRLRGEGFWLSGLDSLSYGKDTVALYYYTGGVYDKICFDFVEQGTEVAIEEQKRFFRHERSIDQVQDRMEAVLEHYENNGYPFASVAVDSAGLDGDELYVRLRVDPGMLIRFDSLTVTPGGVLKARFLSRYLGLAYDRYYSEQQVQSIAARIENLPAVTLVDVRSTFQLRRSKIELELKPEKVNHFDGIIGFVPANDETNKIEVTGEINLSIKNLFQSAKQFEFHWEKYTQNSQFLTANYLSPALFGSPLDLYLAYDQIKQDTLFSNRSLQVAFDYYPTGHSKLRVSYENELGNELNDESGQSGDFRIDYYGLAGQFWKLDNRRRPKQGVALSVTSQVGYKRIDQDSVSQAEATQYSLTSKLALYQKVRKRSVLYAGLSAGWLESDWLYLNDLYRLGGLRSIRGFNENDFYASHYAYTNLEWRFYLEDQSYLVAFYDQGFLGYDIVNGSYSDRPSGVGVGMQFNTAGGDFLILYGLGKRQNQSFSFDSSKIHFGYTALF
ncbi:hypothetical protein BFP72_18650 [Reichenbachiella sp. 5M10]|uniref:BamA/TamA family outer membrane protein n=1 Tax=Reichenbachiella sp. 5M10 TaxID=1889772 RepID=UPI000C150289|nr:BamA/TamA family outer membrane protein [Reichenbachiella sp. 5M10]PIB37285.1 hypothetical protein BFP72_18650 [Reichenbachiella sp. 5M10]